MIRRIEQLLAHNRRLVGQPLALDTECFGRLAEGRHPALHGRVCDLAAVRLQPQSAPLGGDGGRRRVIGRHAGAAGARAPR